MSPRQRILAIKLAEKIAKNPEYAKHIGIEIKNKNKWRIENEKARKEN